MGDRHSKTAAAYHYLHHRQHQHAPEPVHPVHRPTKQHTPQHTPAAAYPQAPFILLHPYLQLARIDEVHHPPASLSLSLPFPAVIVSPHSLSPPPQRLPTRAAPTPTPSTQTKPVAPSSSADGHKGKQCSVQSSAPTTMTPPSGSGSSANSTGPSKQRDAGTSTGTSNTTSTGSHTQIQTQTQPQFARMQRPSIVSQHSSSVPSTPLQVARQYDTRSRSPSPNGGLGSHSPRSVSSEANSTMLTLRPLRQYKCKFETNVGLLGRRRVLYHSSDILEDAKEEPKKTLDPHEDDKLSGDMRELYDRLHPTQENTDMRNTFMRKVQYILETEFPGNEFRVNIFGSSGNMLWTSESDVDICIQTPMTRLEEMHMLAEALHKHGMERVVCIPGAKVRIVKVWDPELQLSCDMNVNNAAALENTRMIKTYVQIDDRVRPLAMIVKHWTKRRMLNDAGIGGTISSYTWICMILNFLQTRDPPILPCLHKLPDRMIDEETGLPSLSSFADDLEKLRGFGDGNTETLGQLLFHFFRLYGHEIDYEKEVISVRQGQRIKREEKNWQAGSGVGYNRLCVEEPFSTDRNLGNSADDYAWHGIHLEIRRAFELLENDQQLEKACEQYQFPTQEQAQEQQPNSIFKKPTLQKTTITSSVPARNGRGGSNHRGGRGGFNARNPNATGRRSSGSNGFLPGRPPFLHSPPIPASPGPEYFTFPRAMNGTMQLHDQLAQQYQMLEMQSNSLRAQLAAQQHAQQAHQVHAAQMHAQAVAQAQAQNRGSNGPNGSPQKSPYINGNSSPRMGEIAVAPNGLPQGFLYHYPGFFNPSQGQDPSSQDAPRTNPSSPSLTNSIPSLRRQIHRPSNASETASLRSHSQPPRGGVPQPIQVGYPAQYFDPTSATFAGYPIARSTPQDTHIPQAITNAQRSPPSNPPEPKKMESSQKAPEIATPKEYLGYYVAEPNAPRQLQSYAVGPIPSFSELAHRRRRVSPEITQPLLNTALRRVSRSPSPLGGHMRGYSTSTGIQEPRPQVNEQRKTRLDSVRTPIDNGPIIVNGSFPTPPREPRMRSDTVESLPPDFSQTPGMGIHAANQHTVYQINQINELHARQQMVLEEMQRQRVAAAESMSPTIVNGSTKRTPSVESNSLSRVPSEGQQLFSALPEGWMNYETSNGHSNNHVQEVSPTRMLAPQWRTPAYTNGLPQLNTSNTPQTHPQEIKSATVPLLSPVFETHTPSPTASRGNLTKAQGLVKETNQQRRPSQTPPTNNGRENHRNGNGQPKSKANDTGSKSAGPNNNNNSPWQQPVSRKSKNGKRKKTPVEQKTTGGEPLPANAAERKGG